ncbi:hypothetical protein KFV02_04035 [Desulfohalobiaceae bacterium Ax17]|uniref:hypothetical protein n=1 Tax=Desulfovulcanus ferrireducens TaxID=2831190 RepID=UPI00207B99C5|nr:hypothetical protein [Desulfovulcanus ferrireducens]MBT8763096.1 hypothetical protein [Desulfovulcanus ferrireducens]
MDIEKKKQKWEIGHIFRLIVLIAGLAFFCTGIWMINSGIKAEGSVDIKSAIVSGTVKSGNAGLFIVVLAFLLMVFSLPGLRRSKPDETKPKTFWLKEKNQKLFAGFALVLLILFAFIFTKEYILLGLLIGIVVGLMSYIINS